MKLYSSVAALALITFTSLSGANAHAGEDLRGRLKGFLVGSHQGGGLSKNPNTLAQFRLAAREGADILEMDLRLSADRIPVVFHDEDLERHTNCIGKLNSKTLAELKNCRLLKGGEPMTSFSEVLEWIRSEGNEKIVLNAEFKSDEVIPYALEATRAHGLIDQVYYQTKNSPEVFRMAREADAAAWLLFKPDTPALLDWSLGLNDSRLLVLELSPEMQTRETIRRIHDAGKLASANAWPLRTFLKLGESLNAACNLVFKQGIDIAITEQTAGCVKQRPRK